MKTIKELLLPHMNMPLSLYLDSSKMANAGSWGTDIEIFTASSLLCTDIYVYMKVGDIFKWQKFSECMLINKGSKPKKYLSAIFLQHTNGVHYDVVLDVCDNKPDNSLENGFVSVGNKRKCYSGLSHQSARKRQHASADNTKNSSDIDSGVIHNHKVTFRFQPINGSIQMLLCSLVNLPLLRTVSYMCYDKQLVLGRPTKIQRILGDGNCLFRALSFVITGMQRYHNEVRQKLINHMKDIEDLLLPHMNMPLSLYLDSSKMAYTGSWGTDIEIFTASSLLSTDIYIYTKIGNATRWQKFSESMLKGSGPKNTCAIYLQHTSGVHYDVVLGVCEGVADKSSERILPIPHEASEFFTHDSLNCTNLTVPGLQKQNICDKHLCEEKLSNSEVLVLDHDSSTKNPDCKQSVVEPLGESQDSSKGGQKDCGRIDNNARLNLSSHRKSSNFSLNAKKNIATFHKSIQYVIYQCTICLEAWPLKTKVKSPSAYICSRCTRDKTPVKKFSVQNSMVPSSVPVELQDLTQIEEMLIARALPVMKVFVNKGGQRGYSGHCINLPQDVSEVVKYLPRYPRDIPLIVIRMNSDRTFKDVYVRKQKIENALYWLIRNNPVYDVTIDREVLDGLPLDGIPDDIKDVNTVDEKVYTENEQTNFDFDEFNVERVYNHETPSSSFLPVSVSGNLEHDAIRECLDTQKLNWPSVGNQPLNEYTTPFLATMAFPTLFPDSKGDPTNPGLLHEMSFSSKVKHLIKFAENINGKWVYRFASHPRFSFWALDNIQRKRALQQSSIFLKQNPAEAHLTIDQLRDMAFSSQSKSFMSKLSRYVSNISGSPTYWFAIREDLKAILSEKGPPTIFFTFSAADMHWPEIHSLFASNPSNLSSQQKRKHVIDNPHIVDWYFTKRLESFIKHWLYDTLGAEWHWYRYEFQARGSIHCHGMAKLKNDPGLCELTEIALKGLHAEKNSRENASVVDIEQGKNASQVVCNFVDELISTWNPNLPSDGNWLRPSVHPCSRPYNTISDSELDCDYIDLLNTVQRHTQCSTKYCLRHTKGSKDLKCRFNYPIDCSRETKLVFEQIHTRDSNTMQFKAKLITKRNDERLNNHHQVQLQGWRANCDIQVILDHHACVEYLSKYAAKGESRSSSLDDAFSKVVHNVSCDDNSAKAIKKIMIKTLGERDIGAQETMHLLQSLKLYSSSFNVVPVNLNPSRRVDTKAGRSQSCTKDSLLDVYAKRTVYHNDHPNILNMNLNEFVQHFKVVKQKLENQEPNIVPRFFPVYSSNPRSKSYSLHCKYQLLRYKPWENSFNDAWGNENPSESIYVTAWHEFLNTPYAKDHVPNWAKKLQDGLESVVKIPDELIAYEERDEEDWMILSRLFNDSTSNSEENDHSNQYNWCLDVAKYNEQQIGEMQKWIDVQKSEHPFHSPHYTLIDTATFSQQQRFAYDIIVNHLTVKSKEPLLLIITGVAGTGKSYLINAVRNYFGERCAVTATTGKAAYAINGVTIHSLLKLPISPMSQKDLSGQCLLRLQNNLADIDCIIIDEYSMLGQTTMGWIDRRCRQITGLKEEIFGGKSIILTGDPGQLPPVGDKPLYHSKPSCDLGQQGYLAYCLFTNVVALTVNQRVSGKDSEQASFRDLLGRLRIGQSNILDWKQLLDRQPSSVTNIDEFQDAVRLYYSNKQVAEYNYIKLKQLKQPIAKINARHSGIQANHVSPQQLFGLQPCLYICKGAKVMLTLNLWPSVGLCNGSTGTIVDIIYPANHQPPDLPVAVIVHFDNYIGPAFANMPACVPIVPITATNTSNNSIIERQQIPLTLAWAITIHKSQGMTLEKAWVDIGQKESALGMSYVAISRVRSISSLVIEPMSFNRLIAVKQSQTLKFRIMEENRLDELAKKTIIVHKKLL